MAIRVTRLEDISLFGLLFKGPKEFFGKIWFVVCILRVLKVPDVGILYFQIEP